MIERIKNILYGLLFDLAKVFWLIYQEHLFVPMEKTKALYQSENHKWLREYHRNGNWFSVGLEQRKGRFVTASYCTKEKIEKDLILVNKIRSFICLKIILYIFFYDKICLSLPISKRINF